MLREKAAAYLTAGATEAWIVFPQSRHVEIYAHAGQRESTSFPLDLVKLFP